MAAEQLVRRCGAFKLTRALFEPGVRAGGTALRSYVTAEDANKLHGLVRFPSTTVLQEYFVPLDRFDEALGDIYPLLTSAGHGGNNLLNVTFRYVRATAPTSCLLNYAPVDSVAIVLYINIYNTEDGLSGLRSWTDAMLYVISRHGGRFYLPYLLTYDPRLVKRMYGSRVWREFEAAKRAYDPEGRFSNQMLEHMR
jgi:FAD/FMN-containing dehydrogenase